VVLSDVRTVDAIRALVCRGVVARAAMAATDVTAASGEGVVDVPMVEPGPGLVAEMRAAGVRVARLGTIDRADVRV
jgi:hypothetical protein